MKRSKSPLTLGLALVTAAFVFSLAVCAQAQTFTALANFTVHNGAANYYGAMIQATDGNYYGTTNWGGASDDGTVFQITPEGTLNDLYSFCPQAGCYDGYQPWSSIVMGSDGNFMAPHTTAESAVAA
jgi:uncharacterized repeat protein (TIGR03803 family)